MSRRGSHAPQCRNNNGVYLNVMLCIGLLAMMDDVPVMRPVSRKAEVESV